MKKYILKEPMNPKFTLYASMSRDWIAKRWFDRFNTIIFPSNTELVFLFDHVNDAYANSIRERLTRWNDRFDGITLIHTGQSPVSGNDSKGRANRILSNYNAMLSVASGTILLGAEDDTFPDRDDTYIMLIKHLEKLPKAAFVQGIAVNRWSKKYLAAITVKYKDGKPIGLYTSDRLEGLHEVTAGGWYCYATRLDLVRDIENKTDIIAAGHPATGIGPDINQGVTLSKMGYKVYTDYDLPCSHIHKDGNQEIVYHPNKTRGIVRLSFEKENNWDICSMPVGLPVNKPVDRRKKRLRIGALIHMYPPYHNAGGELMLHSILREMVRRGHTAKVCIRKAIGVEQYSFPDYTLDGVTVSTDIKTLDDCDCILTHLDRTCDSQYYTSLREMPLVHIVHNHLTLSYNKVYKADLIVYNTEWLQAKVNWNAPSIVVHPPIVGNDYIVDNKGEYITLINLIPEKGSEIFYGLASAMPDRKFLGVIGGYNGVGGKQIIKELPNVTIMDNQTDMKKVYEKTHILLMPSSYESYGRCSIEAAASGIPCIANPTQGLLEALDYAGTFPKSLSVNDWKTAIENIDYAKKSSEAKRRYSELDPQYEMNELEQAIYRLVY